MLGRQGGSQPCTRRRTDGMYREHPQHVLEHQGTGCALVHGQLNPAEIILWLIGRRSRFRVEGDSMLPVYAGGDQVLVNPHAWKHNPPEPREIVLLEHPREPGLCLIKRISHIDQQGRFFVVGDNPSHSTDSRDFGPVEATCLLGKVVGKIS